MVVVYVIPNPKFQFPLLSLSLESDRKGSKICVRRNLGIKFTWMIPGRVRLPLKVLLCYMAARYRRFTFIQL